jgi:hypothetical protein
MASPLWPQIREHRLEITPPRGDALRQAIAVPARDIGVLLEPELVERLLADAGDEPGVLPFVQETLVVLWGHAAKLAIGLDAYADLVGDKSGRSGLQVALAEHAEHVYQDVLREWIEQRRAAELTRRRLEEKAADNRAAIDASPAGVLTTPCDCGMPQSRFFLTWRSDASSGPLTC